MSELTKREEQKVRRLAQEYRSRGYSVNVPPSDEEIPDFFGSYVPDLIASRGQEHIAIEVKSRSTISSSRQLEAIAEAIKTHHPDWRLELVVTNPRRSTPDLGDRLVSVETMNQRVASARSALEGRDYVTALLVGWSAAEALLRRIADTEGVPLSNATPAYITKVLFSKGLLTRSDYQLFDEINGLRNSTAHGFSTPPIQKSLVSRFFKAVTSLSKHHFGHANG